MKLDAKRNIKRKEDIWEDKIKIKNDIKRRDKEYRNAI
jgi:hypothetical protein